MISHRSRGMTVLRPAILLSMAFLLSVPLGIVATEADAAATGDPLPGIDVLVRKKPGDKKTEANFGGGGDLPEIPADFFGPGSDPFTGMVDMQGGGTVGHVDHGRYDLVQGTSSHLFDVEMTSLQLRSIDPIAVSVDGVDSFFDVWVELRAVSGDPADPIGGQIELPAGTVLDPGVSSFVVDSFFDVEYRITFTESGTGNPAGSPLVGTLRLDLQEVDLPVERLGAEAGGMVVLGYDGTAPVPFVHASAGGGLRLALEAVLPEEPVPTRASSFGAVKAAYR